MNKTRLKKDLMTIYMFRNAFATLIVAFMAFMISLKLYYQCSVGEVIQRIYAHDIYTTTYFILIWAIDYLIFEVSKIFYDAYRERVTFVPCIILVVLSIGIYFIPILDLFQYNICFLFLLICVRMIKEMWKRKRPHRSIVEKKDC